MKDETLSKMEPVAWRYEYKSLAYGGNWKLGVNLYLCPPPDGKTIRDVVPLYALTPAHIESVRAMEAENARLREALKPFAKFAGDHLPKQRFFLQLLVCPEDDSCHDDYRPHFQAARAALLPKTMEDGDV